MIGKDFYGNHYYQERHPALLKKPRRFVWFQGDAEASKVPVGWHAWLHGMSDRTPYCDVNQVEHFGHHAIKGKHLPNVTGTPLAQKQLEDAKKKAAKANVPRYIAWFPLDKS